MDPEEELRHLERERRGLDRSIRAMQARLEEVDELIVECQDAIETRPHWDREDYLGDEVAQA